MRKHIAIIGIGMGNPDTLTLEGKYHIEKAQVLIGAKRMIEAANTEDKPCFFSFENVKIKDFIETTEYESYGVLMSGDTGFYSGTQSLLPILSEYEVKVIPGISTLSYFSAVLKLSWEDAYLLSLHGREENLELAVQQHRKTFLLTAGDTAAICERLCRAGLGGALIYAGENLSYPTERIRKGTAEELKDKEFTPLCSLFILNENYDTQYRIGIPDEQFIRGNIPMTKSEVRAIVISKLMLKEDSIVYDIGAGTGSVSVEMAFLAKRGRVYAVEQNMEGVELIRKNRDKFALGNIEVIPGTAPESLMELEKPEAAFIGGSKGSMEEIIKALLEKNKFLRLVITAIALETLGEAIRLMKEYGFCEVEVVQTSIAKAKEAGSYHMLMGQNPVFIISGRGDIA
jgi:precorrin-6Y C5,15-methyltransferase (decarboxylating)